MQKVITYGLIISLLGTAPGCKKFLEKNPDNRASLESPEQVSQLLATAYPQSNYMAFCESISDNVADKGVGDVDLTVVPPYFFKDVTDNQQDSPESYWNSCYTAIAAANQALEACVNAGNDSARYSSQKGEALLCRAYAHFMLVTLFAKPYNTTSSATDAGIPYVLTPEKVIFQKYSRKTVAYVYEMIEKDLQAGIPLLNDTRYTVPRYHFTKAAANAFAARFYLYKQEHAKALSFANAIFSSGVTSLLRPWNSTYLTMTYRELYNVYAKASEPANLLLVETSSWWARNYYSQRYGMDAAKRDEIFGGNPTTGTWAFGRQIYTSGTNNYLLPKINEYFVRVSVNATIGVGYVMVPLFTAEEALFNRIESNIYLNNMTQVVDDLNAYVSTRIFNYNPGAHNLTVGKMTGYYGTANPQQAALYTLLDFKRAEYAQEGMRWFDLQRYNMPVTHTTTDGQVLTLEPDDKRRVFQIPESARLSGVELNPR